MGRDKSVEEKSTCPCMPTLTPGGGHSLQGTEHAGETIQLCGGAARMQRRERAGAAASRMATRTDVQDHVQDDLSVLGQKGTHAARGCP
jgi:hypothetical protein